MRKVFIDPYYGDKPDHADGGIRRVVEAQVKYLPQFGYEVVANPNEAEVINNHGAAVSHEGGIPVVHSGHGLYWSRYQWPDWGHEVNRQVINSMKMADRHTAPSHWVARSLRRGMLVNPEVIYHGVDADLWSPSNSHGGYILWNKARRDPVSDPSDMFRLARMMNNRRFVSTIGNETSNVKICGAVPYEEMKGIIANAGVYLATARETFGIGTLEAMACGVPIVGWNWGGQTEIVRHGETGYLAPPGDYEALRHCIEMAIAERNRLGENARQDVEENWGWPHRIEQYARLYDELLGETHSTKVSIIVTAHNLGKYVGDCLASVKRQSSSDFECIVVDDDSTDGTKEIVKNFCGQDSRFSYEPTPHNLGLSEARNFGFTKANGKYILFLDADDMLDEHAVRIMGDALDADPLIHIAYGHLDTIQEDGGNRQRNATRRGGKEVDTWPPPEFSWRQQMAHLNQLPYCAMMRRAVLERGGGYRKRHWRAEDAAMWCLWTSMGFVAKKVTKRSLLIYRWRNESKTQQERSLASQKGETQADGDWTAWYPWRIAGSPQEAMSKGLWAQIQQKKVPDPALVPFGAQGEPSNRAKSWLVHDYSYPKVSVVIPVGPGHEKYVIDAVESVLAQTYPDWEIIVVNDTGKSWGRGFGSPLAGAPYAGILETEGGQGPAVARNLGAAHARGELLFPLDADDYLLPNCLERMVAYMEEYNGIIYSGWLKNDQDGSSMEYFEPVEFNCGDVVKKMWHSGSSILIPMWLHEQIGGWDEKVIGWEDWDYLIAAQHHGACSYLVPEPLFVYRFHSGTQRESSYEQSADILEYLNEKWRDYRKGEKEMGCGCKAKKKKMMSKPSSALSSSGNFVPETNAVAAQETVMLEYNGPHLGPITIRGPVTGVKYRFGRMESHKRKFVRAEDAEELLIIDYKGEPLFLMMAKDSPQLSEADVSGFAGKPVSEEPSRPEFPAMAA